jgi:hypothetical protein
LTSFCAVPTVAARYCCPLWEGQIADPVR